MLHTRKGLLSLLLCITMLVCLLPIPIAHADTLSGTCGKDLTWTLDTDAKHLIISGSGKMYNYYYKFTPYDIDHEDDRPPWEEYASQIQKVTLPEGLSSIGDFSFFLFQSLTEINIPESVEYIGEYAFGDCSSLPGISLGVRLVHIGPNAFYNCDSLTKITIPDSVTYLGYFAFSSCSNLGEVTIGNGIGEILASTFEHCRSLTGVTIPDSVTSIGRLAFSDCDKLCHVIYTGSDAAWDAITLESGNEMLTQKLCSSLETSCGSYRFCVSCGRMPYARREHSFKNRVCSTCGVFDTLEYTVSADAVVSLWGYTDTSLQFIRIPATVEGLPVRKLEAPFLRDCIGLLGITVPESLREIQSGVLPDVPLHILYAGAEEQWQALGVEHNDLTLHCYAGERQIYWTLADGVPVLYCEICDRYLNRDESICVHPETELRGAVPPGCTENGYSGDLCCLSCGELLEQGEILPATGHCYTSTVTAPTCVESGYTTYTCSACGDTYIAEETPATGHADTVIRSAILPSCIKDGYSGDLCCLSCGELLEQGEILPATGHCYYGHICLYCGERDPKAPIDNPFSDVFAQDYYYTPVLWAVSEGITTGTSQNTFSPDDGCTRGQIVTFLWRASGSPKPASGKNPFRDVQEDAYYYEAVLWAVEQGITTGTGADTFSPDAYCTRAQAVTFLWRSQKMPLPTGSYNPFRDVSEEEYYYYAVLWAVEQGITTGTGEGSFSPNDGCTRGQIVTFLYRTLA